jgi:peroxiredoxin (alkyl hydroperoxide reductase subunit C)
MTDAPRSLEATCSRPPVLDDPAPGFHARTTMGPRTLSDYRGQWLLFFSHPADFTPVCTSEFLAFARAAPRFEALGCDLLALSVDSLYSHIAWLRDIETVFGITVPFPVIEDPSMAIARAYGMLADTASSSATVRAVFAIDPEGIVRAILWYPMAVGRSVEELLRLVAALQAADREGASTPEGWREGEPLVETAPVSIEAAGRGEGAWYLRERRA